MRPPDAGQLAALIRWTGAWLVVLLAGLVALLAGLALDSWTIRVGASVVFLGCAVGFTVGLWRVVRLLAGNRHGGSSPDAQA